MKNEFPYLDINSFFRFPPLETAQPDGFLAAGGNLSPGMLLSAYVQGIFPWYSEGYPVLWWSPDPRFVLFPEKLHISSSLRRVLNRRDYSVLFNERFDEVIKGCRNAYRPGQQGTWITDEMEAAYNELFRLGFVWCAAVTLPESGELAGGVYGVKIGNCFFGESMFASCPAASKFGFVSLVKKLEGECVVLIDCQIKTDHLARFGAQMIPRKDFIE